MNYHICHVDPSKFLNQDNEVICKCGTKLWKMVKEPEDFIEAECFEPIGGGTPVNGNLIKCYQCGAEWSCIRQEWYYPFC